MEFDKENNEFESLSDAFNKMQDSFVYRRSKDDIIQDDLPKKKQDAVERIKKLNYRNKTDDVNQNKKEESLDEHLLNSFTEIEDEEGNIVLIKYGEGIYEYRGNTYCEYILYNEETKYREDGVAQIVHGQKIRIKDIKRREKLKEIIKEQQKKFVKRYSHKSWLSYKEEKNNNSNTNNNNDEDDSIEVDVDFCIGYKSYKGLFFEKFYFYYIDNYEQAWCAWVTTGIGIEVLYNDTPDTTEDSFVFVNKKHYINWLSNKKKEREAEEKEEQKKEQQRFLCKNLNKSIKVLLLSLLFYPVSEFILWIFFEVAPLITDKIPINDISNFIINYFPYGYHPDCKWYSHLSTNIFYLLFVRGVYRFFFEYERNIYEFFDYIHYTIIVVLSILGLLAIFMPKIYDPIASFSIFVVIVAILIHKRS